MHSYAPSHPQQGAIYYRITDPDTKKSVACIWDLESRRGGDQRVIQFSKDVDIMIHDTQYTDEEYYSDKVIVQGFGHSTYTMAIENALAANVKILVPFHYNPNHTDEFLNEYINQLILSQIDGGVNIIPSKERLVIEL
jgi:ribonuclease BN (tRNA processing enzyme)